MDVRQKDPFDVHREKTAQNFHFGLISSYPEDVFSTNQWVGILSSLILGPSLRATTQISPSSALIRGKEQSIKFLN